MPVAVQHQVADDQYIGDREFGYLYDFHIENFSCKTGLFYIVPHADSESGRLFLQTIIPAFGNGDRQAGGENGDVDDIRIDEGIA